MIGEEKRQKYKAFAFSLAIHGVLFLLAAFLGLFSLNVYQKSAKPMNVIVYDADAAPKRNASAANAAGSKMEGSKEALHMEEKSNAAIAKTVQEKVALNAPEKAKNVKKVLPSSQPSQGNQQASKNEESSKDRGSSDGNGKGQGKSLSGKGEGSGSAKEGGKGNGRGSSLAAISPALPPRLLKAVKPDYSPDLRKSGIEGTVYLKIFVTKNGKVSNVAIISSSGQTAFDQAASKAAYQYRFSPALNSNGQPVPCIVRRRIVFRLD